MAVPLFFERQTDNTVPQTGEFAWFSVERTRSTGHNLWEKHGLQLWAVTNTSPVAIDETVVHFTGQCCGLYAVVGPQQTKSAALGFSNKKTNFSSAIYHTFCTCSSMFLVHGHILTAGMQVALLGGTGDIGQGLALRFAADTTHEILIGSRDEEKAKQRATEYESRLRKQGVDREITGAENGQVAADADVVVLAIPPYHVADTVDELASQHLTDQILVSPAVGIKGDSSGMHYHPPDAGSVTQLVGVHAPADVPVVGAFHNLAADRLSDLDIELDLDTLVVGDDDDAKQTVRDLAGQIDGLRALDAGPLANAPEVESVTPLVINIAKYNEELHDVGVTFH